MTDEAEYRLDNYGTCDLGGKCVCLARMFAGTGPWLGRLCASWTPAPLPTEEQG